MIVLLAAKGMTHQEIVQTLGCGPAKVRKQIASFDEDLSILHAAGLFGALRPLD